jgi:hypothetical protein
MQPIVHGGGKSAGSVSASAARDWRRAAICCYSGRDELIDRNWISEVITLAALAIELLEEFQLRLVFYALGDDIDA